ncbi:MAG: YiiX/YebB-like N1pC/P60 family cysteine hydrolase [Candidatus Riflebacteria bacterium]|nr:YiiX/YebB-like N1pC/P60 family cysteine hydrolase [Candidatus Riflebacteria bacterium]
MSKFCRTITILTFLINAVIFYPSFTYAKLPDVTAVPDNIIDQPRTFAQDVKLLADSAEKLSRLCVNAFGKNSYLDIFSNKENIFSNRQVRTAYRFLYLFSRYFDRLDKISKKYEKEKRNNFTARTIDIAAKVVMAHVAANMMTYCKDKPRLHRLFNEANKEFNIPVMTQENLIKHALRPSAIAQIYKFRISHYEEATGIIKTKKNNQSSAIPTEIKNILITHESFMKGIIKQVVKNSALRFLTRSAVTNTKEKLEKIKSMLLGVTNTAYEMENGDRSIKPEHASSFCAKLEPGDIILNRCENNFSNIVLRGFWIHSMLYIGTPEKAAKYFENDDKVKSLCRKYNVNNFVELLQAHYPEAVRVWNTNDTVYNSVPRQIIEAMPSGVIITSAPQALNADHVAAIRPMLRKIDKAKAIMRAFSYFDKTYDICFDFTSEKSVVCTELVAKAYTSDDKSEGLNFQMKNVFGLLMAIPSNIIAEKFSREYNTEKQQLDFVAFMRGSRKAKSVTYQSVKSFLSSYKWDDGLKSKDAK